MAYLLRSKPQTRLHGALLLGIQNPAALQWGFGPSRHSSNIHASMAIFLIARGNKKPPPAGKQQRGEGLNLPDLELE